MVLLSTLLLLLGLFLLRCLKCFLLRLFLGRKLGLELGDAALVSFVELLELFEFPVVLHFQLLVLGNWKF